MFDSPILEVAIGLIFIFLLLSVICSALREAMEALFKTRASYLEYAIRRLLLNDENGQALAAQLFRHPQIFGLFDGLYQPGKATRPGTMAIGRRFPSYIPARNFALALVDIAARGDKADGPVSQQPVLNVQSVRAGLDHIADADVRRVMMGAVDTSGDDLEKALTHIEQWFESSMERIGGWYRRSTQWCLFWLGLGVAVALNVNTMAVAQHLYQNPTARALLVAQAENTAVIPDADAAKATLQAAALTGAKEAGLPIGWQGTDIGRWSATDWLSHALGWLLTALATMLGAPFWFDVLAKVTRVRSSNRPENTAPASKATPATAPIIITPAAMAPAVPPTGPATTGSDHDLAYDMECDVDGCEALANNDTPTADEELPVARGGVA